MASYYMWMKGLHVISIVVWMGGMLTFPWILFYQVRDAASNEALNSIGKLVMRRLINPAAILALVTGILLIIATGAGAPDSGAWMHVKIAFVLCIGAVHGILSKHRKLCERGEPTRSPEYFRLLFGILLVLTVAVVLTVVFKPI